MYGNIKNGSEITIVNGGRFRRVSEDGKSLLDQRLHEGLIVDRDTVAKVVGVIEAKASDKVAYLVDVVLNGQTLRGWVYSYEIAPVALQQ